MKRDLTAWIKAERMVRELRAQIAQLPVGDSTSLVGPRCKDPIFNRHAEAKDSARECENKVRKNERDMRSGAWRPVDINEALIDIKKDTKGSCCDTPDDGGTWVRLDRHRIVAALAQSSLSQL
jgi:hypothetical protein